MREPMRKYERCFELKLRLLLRALTLVIPSILLPCIVLPLRAQQATYTLKATPKTVAWGGYDAES